MIQKSTISILCVLLLVPFVAGGESSSQVLLDSVVHLRSGTEREWSDFPEKAYGSIWKITFQSHSNSQEQCLILTQRNVKQNWLISINGSILQSLVADENALSIAVPIPAETLHDGPNILTIEPHKSAIDKSDDIYVENIEIFSCSVKTYLSECPIVVRVLDKNVQKPTPCRITIVNQKGCLQQFFFEPHQDIAARTGVIYTAAGKAIFSLPRGQYKIFAGRGFEYSIDQCILDLPDKDLKEIEFSIEREVPTDGYVACDTHVHTLTHSGHGDATMLERMITLAGEGIELPIATDHNKQIQYEETAVQAGVRRFFTPVVGSEVTTPIGHFNVFPLNESEPPIDHQVSDWGKLFDALWSNPTRRVAILNHARDIHSSFRPFGPNRFNAVVGENLDRWPLRFNAMEVINSGATQTDPRRLIHDWIALLNRGLNITPVGSSDSHDVSRYIVGQGRTYIRTDDDKPQSIDIDKAISRFVKGEVHVSYGLMTEVKVESQFQSGQMATNLSNKTIDIDVEVLGPSWVQANEVQLLINGIHNQHVMIESKAGENLPKGVRWRGHWSIAKPAYDVNVVVVATGNGVSELYWSTARPYQPTSSEWEPITLGISGSIWIDGDGDGRKTSSREYAEKVFAESNGVLSDMLPRLDKFDSTVAAHAAYLLHVSGVDLLSLNANQALKKASQATREGFINFTAALRENIVSRLND